MPRAGIPVFRSDVMRLSEAYTEYSGYMISYKGMSVRTKDNYLLVYGQFLAYILGLGMQDSTKNFNADTCEGFARYLAANRNSPNSINVKLAALASLARYLMQRKVDGSNKYVLDENPMTRFERPQRQRTNRKFLHRDELSALLGKDWPVQAPTCSTVASEQVMVDLFADTGLRVSELHRASVEHLREAGDGTLVLNVTVKGRGRQQEEVGIPLGPEVSARLWEFLKFRKAGPKDPILVNQAGVRFRRESLSNRIAALAKKAGITRLRVGAHTIRHTYNVVGRVEAKLDPVVRGGLLNQTDTHSIAKYDHLLPDETRDARDKVRAGMRSYIA